MKSVRMILISVSVLALIVFSMPMSAQNTQYPFPGFPEQFSPLRTFRPRPASGPRIPPNKFNRVARAVPNEYIVVLKDETPLNSIATTASSLALAHGGSIKHVWTKALKGFSVRMSEAEAIALSNDSHVLYVEENGIGKVDDTPWGLDRIDQIGSVGTVDSDGFTTGSFTAPNDASGVNIYVIDTGIRTSHHQFDGRASVAYDTVDDDQNSGTSTNTDGSGQDGLDCQGHGTLVASIAAGHSTVPGENSFGVARAATVYSVRSIMNPAPSPSPSPAPTPARPCAGGDLIVDEVVNGIDWVASNYSGPAVANLSFGCYGVNSSCDNAVAGASAAGVTCVVAAGNGSQDADLESPARAPSAITVGSSDNADAKASSSNYGPDIDVFAPGVNIRGAAITSDSDTRVSSGTSFSAPFVTGVVAMYLYDHTDATSSSPAIVQQVIKSNANICAYDVSPCDKVASRGTGSPDRLLYSDFLGSFPSNPIDNQRFFVWQQYSDFLDGEPDESGLDFWTRNITDNCSTGVNDNDSCTNDWRIYTSRSFWVASHGTGSDWALMHGNMFTGSYGLTSGNNGNFVNECYRIYLGVNDVDVNDPTGYTYWYNDLTNNYGNPANASGVIHLIDAFLNSSTSGGYRPRFGP